MKDANALPNGRATASLSGSPFDHSPVEYRRVPNSCPKGNSMRSRLCLILIITALVAVPALAQRRSITEKDLFNFVWTGDTQISPDGSRVAFVRVTVNEKKDGYNTAIWSVAPATGETHQLTSGPRDSTPRWSPDGKFLVFVRVTEKDGKPDLPQLFMLSMAGGDSFQFTTMTR